MGFWNKNVLGRFVVKIDKWGDIYLGFKITHSCIHLLTHSLAHHFTHSMIQLLKLNDQTLHKELIVQSSD